MRGGERPSLWLQTVINIRKVQGKHDYSELLRISDTQHDSQTLDKTTANLETELSAGTPQDSFLNGSPISEEYKASESTGEIRKQLEEEKGIIIRFVIGHSAISGGIVDRAIQAEDNKHGLKELASWESI